MMKKMFKIIFATSLLMTTKVGAITFYTDLLENKLINSNYQFEEVKKYKFYKEEKVGEYLLKGYNPQYTHIDYNNIKYGEYGSYLDQCTDDSKDILNTYLYPYQNLKEIKYVKVYNNSRKININSIKILNQDKEVTYQNLQINGYFNNYLNTGGYILIKLNSPVPYANFNIIISSTDYSKIISYKLYYTLENYLLDLTTITNSNNNQISLNNIPKEHYDNVSYSEKPVEKTSQNLIYKKVFKCRMRNVYYYHYNIEKKYLTGYYENIKGYIKDEENYKIYYRYLINSNVIENLKKEIENLKINISKSPFKPSDNYTEKSKKEYIYKYIKVPIIQSSSTIITKHPQLKLIKSLKITKVSLIIIIVSLFIVLFSWLVSKKCRSNK